MNQRIAFTFILFSLLGMTGLSGQSLPPTYNEDWQKVYAFELQDLPQSALKIVDQIQQKARRDKNSPQIIKTLLYQSKFSLLLEEEAQLKVVRQLELEIDRASSPEKQMLQSILADLLWQYYEQNRWRFQRRTATDELVNKDFRTWDLRRLTEKVYQLYQGSLSDADQLQSKAVIQYASILDRVPGSQHYRPSVYDFLAHRALQFYRNEESGLARPADQFRIDNPLVFDSNENFVAWELPADSNLSFAREALLLFQELTRFHLKSQNQKALSALTLIRLEYGKSKSTGAKTEDVFEKALQLRAEEFDPMHQAGFKLRLARLYLDQGGRYSPKGSEKFRYHRKKALELAQRIQTEYPETEEAIWAGNMIQTIEQEHIQLTTEKYLPIENAGRILVSYRNLEQLHFRALKVKDKDLTKLGTIYNDSLRQAYYKTLEVQTQWVAKLPPQTDYQKHSTEVLLPPLPSGHYLLLATFGAELELDKTYSVAPFQSTDLVLVQNDLNGYTQFEVLNRVNGKPVAGARVNLKSDARRNKLNRNFVTDENGLFTYKVPDYYYQVQVTVETETDRAVFGNFSLYQDQEEKEYTGPKELRARAFVFTDRSIYRPGQPLYFKAIALFYDSREANDPTILTGERLRVTLEDPNGQEVDTQELDLNEFGSIAGEFRLPTTGLTGRYQIRVEKASDGEVFGNRNFDGFDYSSHSVSVEEYKRPKFETSFEPVSGTYKVNDSVDVQGQATAYAGSRITDAQVSYRVVRQPQYPSWYRWYYPDLSDTEVEILQGETTTDQEGKYEIKFKALPDPDADPEGLPVFNYTVYADVTDLNGETRSAETQIRVGYHSMIAQLNIPASVNRKNKKEKIGIRTENLNGEEVDAAGTLSIYKLQAPQSVLRERPWPTPEIQGFEEAEFRKLFPHDPYTDDEANVRFWPKGEMLFSKAFNTAQEKELALGNLRKWPIGRYVAILSSQDESGMKVKDEQRFSIIDRQAKAVADQQDFLFRLDKDRYQAGDEISLQVGTALEDFYIIIEVEKDQKIVQRIPLELNNEIKELKFPVRESDWGGFAIRYHWAAINSFKTGSTFVAVPEPEEQLEIETLSFRNKLQPGTPETWSFQIIKEKKGEPAAELLASMYDASLDLFKGHQWYMRTRSPKQYYPMGSATAYRSFGKTQFNTYHLPSSYFSYRNREFSTLNWFGLSMNNTRWTQNTYVDNLGSFALAEGTAGLIKGTITDESGLPLPGATVVVKGTNRGTQTDFDGNFSIRAKKSDVLVVSYIGMKSLNYTVGNSNTMTLGMEQDSLTLSEVVVTGYGASNRRARRLAKREMRTENMLAGRAAGVQVAAMAADAEIVEELALESAPPSPEDSLGIEQDRREQKAELAEVQARTNLQETAFFFPQLKTDKNGKVSFEFTSPEALTRWKLQLLAHNKKLVVGQQTLTTVTQKELMVLPNPPRFLRESDTIVFSTKIANFTEEAMTGIAQLELTDPFSGESLNAQLKNTVEVQDFSIGAEGNTALNWSLVIPAGIEAVQYRIVAKAGNYSDGEQNVLPVLTNRMLVTESLPLWIKSGEKKDFQLTKLAQTTSATRTNHALTLEITSNPVWYAVQALPYLMEYPYECAEQTFSRYYANALGAYIANSNPKIQEVFSRWKDSDALISNLEKNEDLKSLIIQETPWLRDAQSETEQKKRIVLLFDLVKMEEQQQTTLRKLQQLQMGSGGFPWFKGSRFANHYITRHIAIGFGHLKKLTDSSDPKSEKMMQKAVRFLDKEFVDDYNELLRQARIIREKAKTKSAGIIAEKEFLAQRHIWQSQLHYLYMRSFYPDLPLDEKTREARTYYLKQAETYWKDFNLYSRGLNMMIHHRSGNSELASRIWKSVLENSTRNEELGLYWKENTAGWYWYQAPVETQALLIEVASEILADSEENTVTLDAMKTWLLKNKQTNRWKSTKATTEAIYALLLQGSDWLSEENTLQVTWGGEEARPAAGDVQAGTGYFQLKRKKEEVGPEWAEVSLEQTGKGIAWGALYWQYFENLDKITSAETPLQLTKKLFRKENTSEGEKLYAIEDEKGLSLGDLVRVRIELKSDRDLEFVHMKDMRAAGLEPIDVISRYHYQDGLGYYQSTRDASTNFFFDRLRKGVYVFEYDLRVNNVGQFSNGITTIQCMYAPEFTSHSEGIRIEVTSE